MAEVSAGGRSGTDEHEDCADKLSLSCEVTPCTKELREQSSFNGNGKERDESRYSDSEREESDKELSMSVDVKPDGVSQKGNMPDIIPVELIDELSRNGTESDGEQNENDVKSDAFSKQNHFDSAQNLGKEFSRSDFNGHVSDAPHSEQVSDVKTFVSSSDSNEIMSSTAIKAEDVESEDAKLLLDDNNHCHSPVDKKDSIRIGVLHPVESDSNVKSEQSEHPKSEENIKFEDTKNEIGEKLKCEEKVKDSNDDVVESKHDKDESACADEIVCDSSTSGSLSDSVSNACDDEILDMRKPKDSGLDTSRLELELDLTDEKDTSLLDCEVKDRVASASSIASASSAASLMLDHRKQQQQQQQQLQKGGKSKTPPDSVRPVGRLLYDLGLDLVRQEVYKDLIDIQAAKDDENRLDDKEKGQLVKLTEAHARLRSKNGSYLLPRVRCSQCKYSTTSRNVLELHREHGHVSHTGMHMCCLCDSFRTRYPTQFISHMDTVHRVVAKIAKKMSFGSSCSFCPYEHKNVSKVEAHALKCSKKFQLSANLQPLPSDCDIPIKYKPQVWMRPPMGSVGYEVGPTPAHRMSAAVASDAPRLPQTGHTSSGMPSSVMEIGGQLYSWGNHRGKPLLTSLRSQGGIATVANGPNFNSGSGHAGNRPQGMSAPREQPKVMPSATAPQAHHRHETCEICGMIVDSRQALWTHLQGTHKVELSRVNLSEQEPCIVCEMCKAKFWTYQGLARHSLLLHKRNIAPSGGTAAHSGAAQRTAFRCHLCGSSQTVNPLNHLSTNHNITLLDMYHGRQCCMCNRKLRTGRAFEEHMIQEHRDIFANQDVLRTVLQALSTALYLKSEDIHQNVRFPQSGSQSGLQQPRPSQYSQQNMGGYVHGGGGVRQRPPFAVGSPVMNSSYAANFARQRVPVMNSPGMSHGADRKFRPRAASTPTYRHPAAQVEVAPPVKTPEKDKKTLEEETKALNKLYEDYADIGRPISRSMKHKLLQSPTSSSSSSSLAHERKVGSGDGKGGGNENVKNSGTVDNRIASASGSDGCDLPEKRARLSDNVDGMTDGRSSDETAAAAAVPRTVSTTDNA